MLGASCVNIEVCKFQDRIHFLVLMNGNSPMCSVMIQFKKILTQGGVTIWKGVFKFGITNESIIKNRYIVIGLLKAENILTLDHNQETKTEGPYLHDMYK